MLGMPHDPLDHLPAQRIRREIRLQPIRQQPIELLLGGDNLSTDLLTRLGSRLEIHQ